MRNPGLNGVARCALAALTLACAPAARAELPPAVARAFVDAGVPLDHVAIVVREAGKPHALFSRDADRPMNPASTMKLVTTFAALELLGRDYRWKTEAYLDGQLDAGTLHGNLVLKGHGDPKITLEQWQAFMGTLRANGLQRVTGDLVLDRTWFKLPPHDSAEFDGEPLRPYNVGPDALLVSFKAVKFAFAPATGTNGVNVTMEPALPQIAIAATPQLADGECSDWRAGLHASIANRGASAVAAFPGRYAQTCGEREWYVAMLDHPSYVHGVFTTYFREAGGEFGGRVREGRAPRGARPFAVLESPPLYDIMRDINKLSNNVMARQVFLSLATARRPPPATPAAAAEVVGQWAAKRKLDLTGMVLENGSGLSRNERITANGLARLLAAADASAVREEFASSLAVAATDGTVERRFQNGTVAGQALLKTGSLEGVRALTGYVLDPGGRRFIVVAIINHVNAARGQPALDNLVQWVYRNAAGYRAERFH